jgi:hypothetical protein
LWAADAGGIECGHVAQNVGGGGDQRKRKGSARAFAQAQPQVEQRFKLELIEHDAVAGLRSKMGSYHREACGRAKARGHKCRNARDKAIDHNQCVPPSGANRQAGQAEDLETAQALEPIEHVTARPSMERQGLGNHSAFAREAIIVHTRSPANYEIDGSPRECGGKRGGCRRITNAHFA